MIHSRAALPEPEYLGRIGELAYSVSYMEWTILGDLYRLADRLPEELTLASLEPKSTGAIAGCASRATKEVSDPEVKAYLRAAGKALSHAAKLRNDLLHARPATHPEKNQRLMRAEVKSRQTTGKRFWITAEWFDDALDEINKGLDAMSRTRPPSKS